MKYIKRISLIVVAVLVLACSVPLSSFAVDPVTAATMANAFAQAITAYGASQGVSMTFDVANTDGIGEGVHQLWDQYKADMENSSVTVSDYQNLAASAFPTLWIKIGEKIGVNLDAASVGEIDGFWNWLLSGPAEMVKVDNQYYEWNINQDGSVTPIEVIYIPLYESLTYFQYDSSVHSAEQLFNASNKLFEDHGTYANTTYAGCSTTSGNTYVFSVSGTGRVVYLSQIANMQVMSSSCSIRRNNNQTSYGSGARYNLTNTYNDIYYINVNYSGNTIENYFLPVFASQEDGLDTYLSYFNNPTDDSISVQPYVGDAFPQDVYIPDNTDVNYEPIPAAIPTDISWDDTLFGDGTGTLTDAQSEAITDAIDQAITDNPAKTLELADPATPPVPSPSEVYIPFLPVTLPSFQFSLSGIWHYVTAWVASLGAWFSLVFTTWSYLPYAISVPVYATAVIVIVLGVYKRFFM